METTWLSTFQTDLHQSSASPVLQRSLTATCCTHPHARTHAHTHRNTRTYRHSSKHGSGEWNLVLFGNFTVSTGCNGGKKPWMHEKTWSCHCFNGAEKTAQKNVNNQSLLVSVAAGNMDFGCRVFLSSHIMHHLFIQLNTNTGCWEQLRERPGTAPGENICQFVSCLNSPFVRVCAGQRLSSVLFLAQWHSDCRTLYPNDDVCWIVAGSARKPWQGLFAESPAEPDLSLSWLPWLHAGSKVLQPKRGCEKLCLIPSSGSHLRFHTLLSGHSAELCWGSWVPLTSWHNGWFGLTPLRRSVWLKRSTFVFFSSSE